jgi:LPPG:FO 2-phospho-L-lactate transferase
MSDEPQDPRAVVALAGGVGGARLIDGLDRALPPGALTVVVNTSDDFQHWGLPISPDLDTVMYTLAGLAPEERGWGVEGDTFNALSEAKRRGSDEWFQLGDRDLVTHLRRAEGLAGGESLTAVTAALCRTLGVTRPILPMSDSPRPTFIVTGDGKELAFQEWLVRSRATPAVREVRREGAGRPTRAVLDALEAADLIVICPSNPYVSIDPILELSGVSPMLERGTVIAVSPIVGERAVKGPLARMIEEIDQEKASAEAVATHYGELLDGFVVHRGDSFGARFPLLETNILIQSRQDRVLFARELIEFSRSLI